MKLTNLENLFVIEYPKTMVLNQQRLSKFGTNFISSKGTNNGVSAKIEDTPNYKKYKGGAITVALKGSVMSAYLQPSDFYIAHQTAVLYPINTMSDEQKLFYCHCLTSNKFRFNYGRQADRTLRTLQVPTIETIPEWVYKIKLSDIDKAKQSFSKNKIPDLETNKWDWFQLDTLFDLKKGKRLTKLNMKHGNTPYIGAIDANNGYRQYISHKPIHQGNTITVNYNGSVGEAFYQPTPFWATDDVNVLYPKFNMNCFNALFICTVIKQEKYRFNYGRKWHMERMNISKIKLPVDQSGAPDYKFMEKYVKSLPFSREL